MSGSERLQKLTRFIPCQLGNETHSGMVRKDEDQINDTRWRELACALYDSLWGFHERKRSNTHAFLENLFWGRGWHRLEF